jgi:hypothetical protein
MQLEHFKCQVLTTRGLNVQYRYKNHIRYYVLNVTMLTVQLNPEMGESSK